MPTEKQVTHTLMTTPRCRGSLNMLLISASVDGISVAPVMPRRLEAGPDPDPDQRLTAPARCRGGPLVGGRATD
ncbi:hypothetical protein GCM10010349_41460 [Streptomyces flavofungini]|nr:hypothetical protein GCM10010349_41460 [Streptomyces flavofungini]